jgi:glutathione synthase/RimK-type ligase-like ATP-grasp enzyme
MVSSKPTVAVISTVHWASTARLCLALAEAGLRILALVPSHHALRRLDFVEAIVLGRRHGRAVRDISDVLANRPVDLVVPADERAIDLLRAVHAGAAGDPRIAGLVERSLGDASSFTLGGRKSRFMMLAREEGVVVPATSLVPDLAVLRAVAAARHFPLVLKQDDTFGGMGVRIVHDMAEAERAFRALSANQGLWGAIKEALRRLDAGCLNRRERPITLQQFIAGRPANRAVACDRGQVLAGLSVEVLQASSATGPATVVRVIDHDDMAEAARRIVARLQLSGLVGFDFMIEAATGRAWLLEMNVRPTQICHLAVDRDSDMIGALAARLGAPAARRRSAIPERTIALYPQEVWRDPHSKHFASAFHDVPWHLPQFIEAYRHPVPFETEDWVQRLQRHWRALRQPDPLLPAEAKNASPIPL